MSPILASHPELGRPPAAAFESVVVRRTHADDIEQHTQQLQDWSLHYDQLDCGRFEGQFTDIRLPGLQLFVETTTRRVRQRGGLMPGACSIGTVLHGNGPLCLNGAQIGTETLLVCDATEVDMCTPPDCTFAGLVIDARELCEAAEGVAGLVPRPHTDTLLAVTPPAAVLAPWRASLLAAVQAAVDQPRLLDDPAACRQMRDDLMLTLIDVMAGAGRDESVQRLDGRKRTVDRACELMLSQPDEPPTLLDVCRRVGASPRKLGYCFQDVLGLSPARYLKAIRLNAVRRELSGAGDSSQCVYDAAARWGFWHFGHFSADYKKFFAELPSETLRRSRLQ